MTDVRATNLNLLVLFDALLTTGSVTRAARQVGLTQSGASNALAQLRRVFDDPLFVRQGQGMRPTPRALEVAADVRAGVRAFQRALAPRSLDPATLERTFTVAMPDLVQAVLLPPLLADLARTAPGVDLQVMSWTPHRVPDALATGEVDLFAGFVAALGPDHASAPLWDDVYVAMLRHDHPGLDAEGRLSLEAWLSFGHIIVTTERSGATEVDRALADHGLERRVALRVESALLLPALVASTDLVALIDERLARRIPHPEVVVAEAPLPLPKDRVRAVWRRDAVDPGLHWLIERCFSAVAQAPPRGPRGPRASSSPG